MSATPSDTTARQVHTYNFRKPRLLSQDHLRVLGHVHAAFARDLSIYLSAQLRALVDLRLTSVEQVHYSEFTSASERPSALYVADVQGQTHSLVLEIDPRMVLYTVEKMFGGRGAWPRKPREISQIEKRVMTKVIDRAYAEIERAWSQLHEFSLETQSFETDAEFVQIIPGTEPAVVATFEVQIQDQLSYINICYPYVLVDRMLGRSGIKQWLSHTTTPTEPAVRAKYEDTLRGTALRLQAELGRTRLSVSDILSLRPGDVIPLDRRTQEPIDVRIGSRLQFRAHVGRSGSRHALRIVEQLAPDTSDISSELPSEHTDAEA